MSTPLALTIMGKIVAVIGGIPAGPMGMIASTLPRLTLQGADPDEPDRRVGRESDRIPCSGLAGAVE